jgi:RNA polymerase sigma-70 factor (ECF subfamily)
MPLPDDHLTDAELMRRVQGGESDSFAELARRYRPALVRVAQSRLGSVASAEDVVQETLLSAFKSRHTYRHEFSFRTWLWTILLNHCRAHYQKQLRRQETIGQSLDALPSDQPPAATRELPPLAALLQRERSDLLEALLAELSPAQADALRLRFFGELKFQEIADAMQCSLGTAKNRVQAGLARLAELMRHRETCDAAGQTHSSGRHWPGER